MQAAPVTIGYELQNERPWQRSRCWQDTMPLPVWPHRPLLLKQHKLIMAGVFVMDAMESFLFQIKYGSSCRHLSFRTTCFDFGQNFYTRATVSVTCFVPCAIWKFSYEFVRFRTNFFEAIVFIAPIVWLCQKNTFQRNRPNASYVVFRRDRPNAFNVVCFKETDRTLSMWCFPLFVEDRDVSRCVWNAVFCARLLRLLAPPTVFWHCSFSLLPRKLSGGNGEKKNGSRFSVNPADHRLQSTMLTMLSSPAGPTSTLMAGCDFMTRPINPNADEGKDTSHWAILTNYNNRRWIRNKW